MTGFQGFTDEGLAFLRGLAANNDRDWFAGHRETYDEQLKPGLAALIVATSEAMEARGVPLAGDPKSSQFRLHRDTRFSRDKRPYKTHVSATLTRDGKRMSPGMAYIHIEPEPKGGSIRWPCRTNRMGADRSWPPASIWMSGATSTRSGAASPATHRAGPGWRPSSNRPG